MYNGINEMIDDLMEHIGTENNDAVPHARWPGNNRQRGSILPGGGCKPRLIRPKSTLRCKPGASATRQNNVHSAIRFLPINSQPRPNAINRRTRQRTARIVFQRQ